MCEEMIYELMTERGEKQLMDLERLINNIYKVKYEEKYFIIDNSENFLLQIRKEDIPEIIANQLKISKD